MFLNKQVCVQTYMYIQMYAGTGDDGVSKSYGLAFYSHSTFMHTTTDLSTIQLRG
jgi:hypothetical protein